MLRNNRKVKGENHHFDTTKNGKEIKDAKDDVKKETPPCKMKVWILASRPHTLTASIVPVLVSVALILHHQSTTTTTRNSQYSEYYLGFCFATFACLIQLGTNLYNDYSDFIKGADTEDRVGQARATQKGWLTPYETAFGSTFCLVLATVLGLYLTFLASSWSNAMDYYMIFVTISSVFNAFCYTGGEYPLGYIGCGNLSIGYSGLGDIFVFLYFGVVATITVPYLYLVQEQQMQPEQENVWKSELMYQALLISIPIGWLATAIITVNNLRDRETDVLVGKNTMAVRFGAAFTRLEYTILVIGSYISLIPLSQILSPNENSNNGNLYLPLLSFPLAMKELKAVGFGGKDGAALNPHVGGVAKVQLLFCLLWIVGLTLSHTL